MSEDLVVIDPYPNTYQLLFRPERRQWLESTFRVVAAAEGSRLPDSTLEDLLPEVVALVGQMDLPVARLEQAKNLRVVFNAGGNFRQNVDYEYCFRNRIHFLNCGPAFAQPVAEMSIGLALDLARGFTREDRYFRAGRERYLSKGNEDAILLQGAQVGILGFGYLGRSLVPLLVGFRCRIGVHDPWVPASAIKAAGAVPLALEALLAESQFVFIMAGVFADNMGFLDRDHLSLVPEGARIVLASRAAVVDFEALLDLVEEGRFYAAIDVWPEEPVPQGHRARRMEGLVLSPHHAGGIKAGYFEIGEMICDDLDLIWRGLPPVRMQPATWELVNRYRSR